MRLLDRLLTEGFSHDLKTSDLAIVHRTLSAAQLVVADNVAEYYWDRVKDDGGNIYPEPSDFPNVMLPFETTFVEMRLQHVRPQAGAVKAGMLLQVLPKGSLEPYWYTDSRSAEYFADHVEWHMLGYVFYQYGKLTPKLISRFALPIRKDGSTLASVDSQGLFYSLQFMIDFPGSEKDNHDGHVAHFQGVAMPAFLALSFMHCRNVTMKKEAPPAPLSKKHQKRTGKPLLRYHVIQIDHMKQVLDREGHASAEGLKKALHICRGHFKHYGRDGKGLLFGKHAATVWIPMHTRGTIEEGVVVKDYHVK